MQALEGLVSGMGVAGQGRSTQQQRILGCRPKTFDFGQGAACECPLFLICPEVGYAP